MKGDIKRTTSKERLRIILNDFLRAELTILQLVSKDNLTALWLPSSVPTTQELLHVTVCCAIKAIPTKLEQLQRV